MLEIESIRSKLLSDNSLVKAIHYGQGSFAKTSLRSISQIAKTAVSDQRKCLLLYNLIQHYRPRSILELGTCLGVSTYYMKLAARDAGIISIEGHPDLHHQSITNAPQWIDDTLFLIGDFKSALHELISEGRKFDMLYVDGDHSSDAQEELWPLYEALSHNKTVYILDDIYWSKDMAAWWKDKKKSKQFNVAIDLYHFGILRYEAVIKEAIDVKIFPRRGRWQLGIGR